MPTVEALIREAHQVLLGAGIHLSPAKISKTCREYLHKVEPTGVSFGDYIGRVVDLSVSERVGLDAMYKRITYADPTGEDAVYEAMQKRGGRP